MDVTAAFKPVRAAMAAAGRLTDPEDRASAYGQIIAEADRLRKEALPARTAASVEMLNARTDGAWRYRFEDVATAARVSRPWITTLVKEHGPHERLRENRLGADTAA